MVLDAGFLVVGCWGWLPMVLEDAGARDLRDTALEKSHSSLSADGKDGDALFCRILEVPLV